jgi:SagB-type dehydrogenase family enzyme
MRRSTRQFAPASVSLSEIAQLLWAAQGVTGLGGLRTAPSAGALYPMRTYLFCGRVRGLPVGMYRYFPDDHYIRFLLARDVRPALLADGIDRAVADAPALIALATDYKMPTREFGEQARRLVHIEAGHIGQNVCLEATAIGIGAIGLGSFPIEAVRRHLGLRDGEEPVYILAVGRKPGEEPVV